MLLESLQIYPRRVQGRRRSEQLRGSHARGRHVRRHAPRRRRPGLLLRPLRPPRHPCLDARYQRFCRAYLGRRAAHRLPRSRALCRRRRHRRIDPGMLRARCRADCARAEGPRDHVDCLELGLWLAFYRGVRMARTFNCVIAQRV